MDRVSLWRIPSFVGFKILCSSIGLIHLIASEHLLSTRASGSMEFIKKVLGVFLREFLVFKFILLFIYVESLFRVYWLCLLARVMQLIIWREEGAAQIVLVKGVPSLVWEGRFANRLLFFICSHCQIIEALHLNELFSLFRWRGLKLFGKAKRTCSLVHSLFNRWASVMILRGWWDFSIRESSPTWLILFGWSLSLLIVGYFDYDVVRHSFFGMQAKRMICWYFQNFMSHCELNLVFIACWLFRRYNVFLIDRYIYICWQIFV
jgi:hypothetical protein